MWKRRSCLRDTFGSSKHGERAAALKKIEKRFCFVVQSRRLQL